MSNPGNTFDLFGATPTMEAKLEERFQRAKRELRDEMAKRQGVTVESAVINRPTCGNKHPEILASAIRETWSTDKVELAIMRADRPPAPNVHTSVPDWGRELEK